jgi:hypothetical protein
MNHCHFPSGRIAIETLIRFLIEEMSVPPIRNDWDEVLTETNGNSKHTALGGEGRGPASFLFQRLILPMATWEEFRLPLLCKQVVTLTLDGMDYKAIA